MLFTITPMAVAEGRIGSVSGFIVIIRDQLGRLLSPGDGGF
jgi:hypothetical protein